MHGAQRRNYAEIATGSPLASGSPPPAQLVAPEPDLTRPEYFGAVRMKSYKTSPCPLLLNIII